MNFDGKQFTIESGKVFYIPIYGIHHDEKFYVNPEKFDPERFSKQNRASIVPDTYLPFGELQFQLNCMFIQMICRTS